MESADKKRRRRLLEQWRERERELLEEIVATAESIIAARRRCRTLVVRHERVWRLLQAIEQSRYCPSMSDMARLLCVPRQRAHEVIKRAMGAGYVEALPNPDDRRILQVFLTARGRSALAGARMAESNWIGASLHGLSTHDLVRLARTLRALRHRFSAAP